MAQTTTNSRIIKASAEAIYKAFTNPLALQIWQAPGDMTAIVHNFDLRVGDGYEMSLFYSEFEKIMLGKTQERGQIYSALCRTITQ